MTHPMQGTYVDNDGKKIGISWCRQQQCRCKDGAGKVRARGIWHGTRLAQARQGQCNSCVTKEVTGGREKLARQGHPSAIDAGGAKGERGATAEQR
jgi:hypothetical protein